MADLDPSGLEAELRELGRRLDLPPAGQYAPVVLARLAALDGDGPPAPAPWWRSVLDRRRRVRRTVAAAVLAGLGVLAVSPAGQAAVARVLRVAGVVLDLGASADGSVQPPRRPEVLPGETAGTLAEARRQASFPVTVPQLLGDPDQVTVSDAGRVVSLVYRAAPGLPAPGPGGVAARVDEFDGTLDGAFLKQVRTAEFVDLGGGAYAVWIAQPHPVTYLDATGTPRTESAHLAERTLIWEVAGVAFRLEGGFSRDQALAVARSTLPAGTG